MSASHRPRLSEAEWATVVRIARQRAMRVGVNVVTTQDIDAQIAEFAERTRTAERIGLSARTRALLLESARVRDKAIRDADKAHRERCEKIMDEAGEVGSARAVMD